MEKKIAAALARYRQEQGLTSLPALQAVLFDMDGVLYDSMPAHARSWVQAAGEYGLRMSPEDAYMYEGQTGGQTIELLYQSSFARSATAEERAALYARKTELFVAYNSGAVVPDIYEVLAACQGLQRLVVTGSSQASLLERLEQAFPQVFSAEKMVTGKDVTHGKPHPEPYLKGLQLAGVPAAAALVVENAPKGVRAAVEAGVFTVAVNTGPLADEILLGEGAHLLLPDMKSLARALPLLRAAR